MSKKKLTSLSLKQKLQILKEVDENVNKTAICIKYKCNKSTLYRIIKNKNDIKKAATESKNIQQKRNRKGLHDSVEKALAIWFDQQRQKNCIVTSLLLINKAKEFAVEFGEDFEPDSNWLFRWKKERILRLAKFTVRPVLITKKVLPVMLKIFCRV